MAKNYKKPAIRFKGFTDDWEQCELDNLGSTFTGLSGKSKEDFGHGEAKFITYMNVFLNPIASEKMLESVEIDKMQHEVKYGDVLFTTSSETPEEVGMSSIWLKNSQNIYLNSFCFGFRPQVKIEPYFFAYLLRSNSVRKQIVLLAQGISRFNISKTKMMDIKVMLPSLEEQRAIGRKFVEIDNLITLHQRKYDKLLNVKKSLLEKMFPKNYEMGPAIRFKGFTDDWKQCELGKIGTTYTGLSGKSKEDFGHGKAKYITYMNVFKNPIASVIMTESIEIDHSQREVKYGDVFFTTSSETPEEVGMSSIWLYNSQNTYLNSFCFGYRLNNNIKIDMNFLAYLLRSSEPRKSLQLLAQGISRFNISKTKVMEMKIATPKQFNEQEKIGKLMISIDNLITLHQRKCEKLKNIKKALLEKMFV